MERDWKDNFKASLKIGRVRKLGVGTAASWVLRVRNVSSKTIGFRWILVELVDGDGFRIGHKRIEDPRIAAKSQRTFRGDITFYGTHSSISGAVSSPEGDWETSELDT